MQSTTTSTRTFQTSSTKSEPPRKRRQIKLPRVKVKIPKLKLRLGPWLIILLLIVVSLFLYQQYREAKYKLETSTTSPQITGVINQVRKLVVLPANEKPTVATVQDASKLRSQSFFANAKNGDKVLIYNNEKEAILYRPSTNQIVTIAPVSTGVSPNQ